MCMRNLTPVGSNVTGIGGMVCDVSLKGNLTVVFETDSDEYVAELKGVLFSLNQGCDLISPNEKFDGDNWDRLGGSNRVVTAFNGRVTFSNQGGMLVAASYRLGEDFSTQTLPALVPSDVFRS